MSNNNNLITDIRWATFIHFIYAYFYLFVYFFNENTFTVYLTGINKILLDLTPLNGKKNITSSVFLSDGRRGEV